MKTNTEKAKKFTNHATKLYKDGQIDKAIEVYQLAIKADKYYAKAYYKLGTLYINQDEYEKAIEYLKLAIDNNPRDAVAYNNLGCCYLSMSEYDIAIDLFNKSIIINPNYIRPYTNRATAYREIYMDDRADNDDIRSRELENSGITQPQVNDDIDANELTIEQLKSTLTTTEEAAQ